MSIHRREFMKLVGISVASLYLSRGCAPSVTVTCYTPAPISPITPPPATASTAREHLRRYWLRFDELTRHSRDDTENKFGQELVTGHRAALDELIADGGISAPVADLVQEAYEAAVYHVWRSNAPMTCYDMAFTYAPNSAAALVEQSQVLNRIAREGTIDPATLAKAQAALEHDMAFYALTDDELKTLYDQLLAETGQYPSFEDLPLELTQDAKEATQFIIDLLTNK